MIYASIYEGVCCEDQMHFVSSLLATFAKNVLGTFSQCMHLKTKLFAMKFRHILEVIR